LLGGLGSARRLALLLRTLRIARLLVLLLRIARRVILLLRTAWRLILLLRSDRSSGFRSLVGALLRIGHRNFFLKNFLSKFGTYSSCGLENIKQVRVSALFSKNLHSFRKTADNVLVSFS
jgi:hypothetical protein